MGTSYNTHMKDGQKSWGGGGETPPESRGGEKGEKRGEEKWGGRARLKNRKKGKGENVGGGGGNTTLNAEVWKRGIDRRR